MTLQFRSRLATVMLVCSALALIATSRQAGISGSTSGEVNVGPERSAAIDVAFHADVPSDATEIRGHLEVPRAPIEPRIVASNTATVDGVPLAVEDGRFEVPVASCPDRCVVRIHSGLTWVGPAEPDLTVRWSAGMFVASYDESGTITAEPDTVEPSISRVQWWILGLFLGGLTGVGWLLAGTRFRNARLAVAALATLVPAVFLIGSVVRRTFIGPEANGPGAEPSVLGTTLFLSALPGLFIGLGLRAHRRGRPLPLAITGWLYLLGVGAFLTTSVESATSYRAVELVILGVLVSVAAAAAITSPGLLPGARGASVGQVIVLSSQAILLVAVAITAIISLPSLLMLPAVLMDPELRGTGMFGLFVSVLFAGLFIGVVRWRNGRRWLLVIANGVVAFPATAIAFGFATGPAGDLFPGFGAPFVVLAGAAAVGVVGGLIVAPPSSHPTARPLPPDPKGNDEGGDREQVGSVHREADGHEVGDTA